MPLGKSLAAAFRLPEKTGGAGGNSTRFDFFVNLILNMYEKIEKYEAYQFLLAFELPNFDCG
jgi:hypothetical protein